MSPVTDWHLHLVEDDAQIGALLSSAKRIAVLGIRPASATGQPSADVPAYVQRAGFTIVPVPSYFPDVTEILGEPVYRSISAIPERVDIVNVFRRAGDIPAHIDDIIAAKPRAVWFQLGIRNDFAAERLAQEGIDVVQDRCMKIELMRRGR